MVVKYYPELLLLQSKQLLFSLAVDPVVLILVSFIISTALVWGIHTNAKLEFADLILNRLVKVNILNYLLVPVSVFVIWVSFISPFWAWKQAEVSPVKLYKIFTDQPIVDKQAHQRIAISPEQTIEVHMKALKEEDYRTAFMATSGSVNADDMDY
jgi:hypothetical protein